MKGPGATRVMFGTNWPMLSHQRCLDGLAALELSEAQQQAFLAGNARRVFGLSA
jgi:predicted TIM-barrel fold metal-dependent hydrolase